MTLTPGEIMYKFHDLISALYAFIHNIHEIYNVFAENLPYARVTTPYSLYALELFDSLERPPSYAGSMLAMVFDTEKNNYVLFLPFRQINIQ